MTIQAILLPAFIEVALVFVLLGMMIKIRMAAFKSGLRPDDVALGNAGYPPKARQISSAYSNQFEIPVLFFVAVILGIVVRQAGTVFVLLEWLFVAARIGHAYVFVTSNNLKLRGPLFGLSAAATALLWIVLALGVLIGPL